MSIHPSVQPTSREGMLWNAIGDLRREVGRIRAARANQIQHAYAESIPAQAGLLGTTTLASLSVNIPTSNHRALLTATAVLQQSNNTSTWALDYNNDVELTTDVEIGEVSNTSAAQALGPVTFLQNSGPVLLAPFASLIDPYNYAAQAQAPTPGDHTWNLKVVRLSGTATLTVSNVRFWIVVL